MSTREKPAATSGQREGKDTLNLRFYHKHPKAPSDAARELLKFIQEK